MAIIAHTQTLIGNIETADTFVRVGKATGGWSDVGLSTSESMISEVEHLMDETNKMLTKSLEEIIGIESAMHFVLGASGNITQMGIDVLLSEKAEFAEAFIKTPLPWSELVLTNSHAVPLVNYNIQSDGDTAAGRDGIPGGHERIVISEEIHTQTFQTEVAEDSSSTTPTNKTNSTTDSSDPPINGNLSAASVSSSSKRDEPNEARQSPAPKECKETSVKGKIKCEVHNLIHQLTIAVELFWKKLQPSLLQVGKWLHSMGAKMQGFIEQFSQTIDKAQKTFDQVMAKLAGPSPIKDKLVFNTFNIFDVNHRQAISPDDIQEVSSLFGVTALAGSKGADLLKKYDADKDGFLNINEYSNFVDDPSVPGCMSYVLRTFAKKLSQIAGKLKGAKMRDEISETVVEYFELMVAKNLTKTKWVSNALTNGSLPIQFSADVFYQLVKQDKSPDKLTDLPVGQTIVGFMVEMAPDYVQKIVKEVANTTFWEHQGFDKKLQAPTVKQIKKWIKNATGSSSNDGSGSSGDGDGDPIPISFPDKAGSGSDAVGLLSTAVSVEKRAAYKALLDEVEGLTDEVIHSRMRNHQRELRERRIKEHESLFYADATRVLFRHLLGDVGSKASAPPDPDVAAVTKGGVLALPPTLEFAGRLYNNGSRTSTTFQKLAFDYAKTSSNPIDNFANQIQSFIKKVEQFLDLMMQYTTPEGIKNMHKRIEGFIEKAAEDVDNIVDKMIDHYVGSNVSISGFGLVSLGSKQDINIHGVHHYH
jgi:hypothetical protein